MTDSTTRPPRTDWFQRVREHLSILKGRAMADWKDPAIWDVREIDAASVALDEAEAAAPDAGLREALERIAEMTSRAPHRSLPVYAVAVDALAAHRSSDPSPATCPECGRVFEIIPHVHDGVTYSRAALAGPAVDPTQARFALEEAFEERHRIDGTDYKGDLQAVVDLWLARL